jgi:hypothetical protein
MRFMGYSSAIAVQAEAVPQISVGVAGLASCRTTVSPMAMGSPTLDVHVPPNGQKYRTAVEFTELRTVTYLFGSVVVHAGLFGPTVSVESATDEVVTARVPYAVRGGGIEATMLPLAPEIVTGHGFVVDAGA